MEQVAVLVARFDWQSTRGIGFDFDAKVCVMLWEQLQVRGLLRCGFCRISVVELLGAGAPLAGWEECEGH